MFKVAEQEFSKVVGRTTTMTPEGKRSTKADTQPVRLQVPEIDPRATKSLQDVFTDVDQIIAQQLPGFQSVESIIDVLNLGFTAVLQRSLRTKGADVRRTKAQNKIFLTFVELVGMGGMSEDSAIQSLGMNGMADAADEFRAACAARRNGQPS